MAFTNEQIAQVWLKAQYVDQENDRNGFRKDQCGAWIRWWDYGNRISAYGWEIDHVRPVAQGGSDALTNLRPLHWRNNAAKSDGKLWCAITAVGVQNGTAPLLGAGSLV